MENLIQKCMEDASKLGMDLNYFPVPIGDEAKMTNDEWLALRRTFIGGSNAGITLGLPAYAATKTSLAEDKRGISEKEEVDSDKQFIFDSGHAMEPVIAKKFATDMGFLVYPDTTMYRHPLFPFMGADADFLCVDHDGYRNGVEIKTTNPTTIKKWESGVYGRDAVIGQESYVAQCRHYMAVFNMYRWWIVIAVPGMPNTMKIVRVDRDMLEEKILIDAEKEFWEEWVLSPEMPLEDSFTEEQYDKIRPKSLKHTEAPAIIPDEYKDDIDQLIDLSNQKSALNSKIKSITEDENAVKSNLIAALSGVDWGVLEINENVRYELTYRASSPRVVLNVEKLKLLHPEIYDALEKEEIITKNDPKPAMRVKVINTEAKEDEVEK